LKSFSVLVSVENLIDNFDSFTKNRETTFARCIHEAQLKTMKKITYFIMVTVMMGNNLGLFAQPIKQSGERTYKNPLPVVLADPYVLYVKGDKYYMYGTGGARHGFAAIHLLILCIGRVKGRYGLQAIRMGGAIVRPGGTAHTGHLKCTR
jgi:hypothetical protein